MSRRTGWALLITANLLFWCMLSLLQTPAAAQRSTGGIQAPLLTHLTWSVLMLRFLPPLFRKRRTR